MYRKSWLLASILAASLPVSANSLFKPVEVSDQELAQLRGRYILPDRIVSFGVVMTSTWQNSAGQIIGAEVALNVVSGQVQPTLYVRQISSTGSGSVSPGTGVITGGSGLDSVQGIVQSVRTAGDLNTGLNDLQVRIVSGNSATTSPEADAQPWTGSQEFSSAAGLVNISSRAGGINIALQASQGQGSSSQQIGGGVAQHANISGSLNQVRNLAALNVALRDNPRSLNMDNCIEQLRALRPHGY